MFDNQMTAIKITRLAAFYARIGIFVFALSLTILAQGKNPVILIPGLTGSELRHRVTGEKIWLRAVRAKSEDLRLPITADFRRSSDDLIAGDVLREVKFGGFSVTDVYGGFIRALEIRGGYHEERWDSPSDDGFQDSLYVFAYDWRLDNVDNARILVRKVEALKLKLKKPDLRFDIVAHSMGGLISRYAAMYGDADLSVGNVKPAPTWAGAKLFDKIVLLGTPNEGSASAVDSLVNGYSIGGFRLDLPFLEDMSKFTIFTVPSAYQLLPAPGTFRVFDENLQPLPVDLYDPKVWAKYGWNPMDDENFSAAFRTIKTADAERFFTSNLDRARRLHEALATANGKSDKVAFYAVGADCRTALDAVVIYQDAKGGKWKTLFQPKEFLTAGGKRVSADELKKVMFSPGDGVVTQRSLNAATVSQKANVKSIFNSRSDQLICGEHNRLATGSKIQDYIIGLLSKQSVDTDAGDNTEN